MNKENMRRNIEEIKGSIKYKFEVLKGLFSGGGPYTVPQIQDSHELAILMMDKIAAMSLEGMYPDLVDRYEWGDMYPPVERSIKDMNETAGKIQDILYRDRPFTHIEIRGAHSLLKMLGDRRGLKKLEEVWPEVFLCGDMLGISDNQAGKRFYIENGLEG